MIHYSDDWLTVLHGDVRDELRTLPDESVHCVITSPPYWGLRDYGQPDQLGLEPTPEQYVENMVAVFREVRRVLRSDGTLWLNLGDSYASTTSGTGERGGSYASERAQWQGKAQRTEIPPGLKPKDLVGIPWRVAFALQADGWYLRSDIIWSKPNPMPESVTDRPTKSHEYLFLLSKAARYYFDADAVRETYNNGIEAAKPWAANGGVRNVGGRTDGLARGTAPEWEPSQVGRNIRSVWTIATAPYPGAHFATFPPKLVEPCIKAGTSEKGVCPECGRGWRRVTETSTRFEGGSGKAGRSAEDANANGKWRNGGELGNANLKLGPVVDVRTISWIPSCIHGPAYGHHHDPVPATVLDPFAGSGTTGMVAQSLSRRAVLIDLNVDYLGQLMERNRDIPLGLEAS